MYDKKNLAKFPRLGELAPEAFKAFVAFDEAVMKHGVIPLKYKELIAVAVALAIATRGKSFHEGVTDHLILNYIRGLEGTPTKKHARMRRRIPVN